MAKDTYYFSHDYEPTGDPKMSAMISEYGGAGYGIFWRIVEMLHADSEHRLPLKRFFYIGVAGQMKSTPEFVEELVKKCIDIYELFLSDGEKFYSNRVYKNIEDWESKKKVKADAGRLGGIKSAETRKRKQNEAVLETASSNGKQNEALLDGATKQNEANEAKERKGKERKEELNSNIIPIGSIRVKEAANKAWTDDEWIYATCKAHQLEKDKLQLWLYQYNASLSNDIINGFNVNTYKKMFGGWLNKQIAKGYNLPDPKKTGRENLKTLT